MNDKPTIRYEDNAEQVSVNGWACKTCGRFFGKEKHLAQWHCANDLPCSNCGGRNTDKTYVCCKACLDRKKHERWLKRLESAVPWDGESALEGDGDFYFDIDSLCDYLANHEDVKDEASLRDVIEGMRLCLCKPDRGPRFEMADFLSDSLPDDPHYRFECDDIDKIVNDWIEKHAPFSWMPTSTLVTIESIFEATKEILKDL